MTAKLIETQIIRFWLPGAVVPKARPRVTRNGSYLPERYQNWRVMAEGELLCQVSDRSTLPLPHPVSVSILLKGKGHRGDLDNLSGSILDALVSAGILEDDRLSCVSRLLVECDRQNKEVGALVEIEPTSLFRCQSLKTDNPCPICKTPGWDMIAGCENCAFSIEDFV